MDSRYITSANHPSQLIEQPLPEVAFVGRSNCGKSTLLNALLRRKSLARTSRTPGRTQMVNFFELNKQTMFVDLPGYGFAQTSNAVRRHWDTLVRSYLERDNIRQVLFLMDCRRDLDSQDEQVLRLLKGKPVHFVLTKADKLNRGAIGNLKQRLGKTVFDRYEVELSGVTPVSSTKRLNIDALEEICGIN